MLHIPPTNLLLAAKQEPNKKRRRKKALLPKNIEELSGKNPEKWTGRQKNVTERVTGLGRRTGEKIAKWNQMTALRFQTGGRHQTSPATLRGCHSGRETCSHHDMIVPTLFKSLFPFFKVHQIDSVCVCVCARVRICMCVHVHWF